MATVRGRRTEFFSFRIFVFGLLAAVVAASFAYVAAVGAVRLL